MIHHGHVAISRNINKCNGSWTRGGAVIENMYSFLNLVNEKEMVFDVNFSRLNQVDGFLYLQLFTDLRSRYNDRPNLFDNLRFFTLVGTATQKERNTKKKK